MMKGSDKQIKWAEEIQERVINIIDQQIADCEKFGDKVPAKVKANAINALNNLRSACDKCENASAMINCYKDVTDGQKLLSVTRIHHANTPAERELLCK